MTKYHGLAWTWLFTGILLLALFALFGSPAP